MKPRPWLRAVLGGSVMLFVCGCALTSKSDPVIMRYFTPERTSAGAPSPAGARRDLALRLGRVNAASHIKDRIAFREAGREVGYYDELRWTEKPEAYVRRAVARALFEERGVQQLIARPGPTLEVELDAFEEVRAPKRVARVQMTWLLRDDQVVEVQRTFTVERPIAPSDAGSVGDDVASAMADAMDEGVGTVVAGAMAELERSAAASTPTP